MNVNGYRYAIEVPKGPGSGWKPIISGDDESLMHKLYVAHISGNKHKPARLIDRSIDKVLRYHPDQLR